MYRFPSSERTERKSLPSYHQRQTASLPASQPSRGNGFLSWKLWNFHQPYPSVGPGAGKLQPEWRGPIVLICCSENSEMLLNGCCFHEQGLVTSSAVDAAATAQPHTQTHKVENNCSKCFIAGIPFILVDRGYMCFFYFRFACFSFFSSRFWGGLFTSGSQYKTSLSKRYPTSNKRQTIQPYWTGTANLFATQPQMEEGSITNSFPSVNQPEKFSIE